MRDTEFISLGNAFFNVKRIQSVYLHVDPRVNNFRIVVNFIQDCDNIEDKRYECLYPSAQSAEEAFRNLRVKLGIV